MSTITITVNREEAEGHQRAVFEALQSAEANHPGSPSISSLHEALAALQAFLLTGEGEAMAPLSGGDKPGTSKP